MTQNSATTENETALAAEILALHRPWYEINGVRHDNVVVAYFDDEVVPQDHRCITGGPERCDSDEHYALACLECRTTVDDGELNGYLLWPCATAQIVARNQSALVAGLGVSDNKKET